jgi:hypothetical protein
MARTRREVRAELVLSAWDDEMVRRFLEHECGLDPGFIVRRLRLSVFEAKGRIAGVDEVREPARVALPTEDTRWTVFAPGGGSPRRDLDPGEHKVGLRVRREAEVMGEIEAYRERLLAEEPSIFVRDESFEPTMALLRPGSDVDRDLRPLGQLFRKRVPLLRFDAFIVRLH